MLVECVRAPLPLNTFIKVKKQNKAKILPEWLFKRQQTMTTLICWPFIWSYNHDTILQSKIPGPEAVRQSSLSWIFQGCPGWSLCFHNLMDWGFRMGVRASSQGNVPAEKCHGFCHMTACSAWHSSQIWGQPTSHSCRSAPTQSQPLRPGGTNLLAFLLSPLAPFSAPNPNLFLYFSVLKCHRRHSIIHINLQTHTTSKLAAFPP